MRTIRQLISGKEIRGSPQSYRRNRATGIICDDELSPAQLRNLEDALGTKVMDRTMVILDILLRVQRPVKERYRLR